MRSCSCCRRRGIGDEKGNREQGTGNCLGVEGSLATSRYLFPVPCFLFPYNSYPLITYPVFLTVSMSG